MGKERDSGVASERMESDNQGTGSASMGTDD